MDNEINWYSLYGIYLKNINNEQKNYNNNNKFQFIVKLSDS